MTGQQGSARNKAGVPTASAGAGSPGALGLLDSAPSTRLHGAQASDSSLGAFLPTATTAPGSPAGPHSLKPSLGSAWAGPALPHPVPREEEAALKRMRLSARLSGSSFRLEFHTRAGCRRERASHSPQQAAAGPPCLPQTRVSLQQQVPLPWPAQHPAGPLQDGQRATLPPSVWLGSLRPGS